MSIFLKNKDYFPHPSNLRNDRRMRKAMKDVPGGVGYGLIVSTAELNSAVFRKKYYEL